MRVAPTRFNTPRAYTDAQHDRARSHTHRTDNRLQRRRRLRRRVRPVGRVKQASGYGTSHTRLRRREHRGRQIVKP